MGECSAYCAFTKQLVNDKKSIYYWTLCRTVGIDCYRSVGIVKEKSPMDKRYAHWMDSNDHQKRKYFFNGFQEKWYDEDTVTLKLDYIENKFVIFKNYKYQRQANIDPNTSYYFALLLCASGSNTIKIIKTEVDKLEEIPPSVLGIPGTQSCQSH